MSRELDKLIKEQEIDNNNYQFREVIPFQKLNPYQEIKNERIRAIIILHKCGYSANKLSYLLGITKRTIFRYLSKGYAILNDKK